MSILRTRTPEVEATTPGHFSNIDALEAFFDRVSPQDLYYRFLSGMKKVDKQRIDAMVCDDDDMSIDFLALDGKSQEILSSSSSRRRSERG